jgi:hypothetical protein
MSAALTPGDLADLEALLADPRRRPPGGWSVHAEAWTEARLGVRPHDALALPAERRRRREAEADAQALFTTLEAERAAWRAGGR